MAARGAAQVLRERIGIEATDALSTMMNESTRSMAEEIVRALDDRFERRLTEGLATVNRRLTEEISGLRVEMHKGFGDLRAEMHGREGELRAEMHGGFGGLRAEMHGGFGEVRAEMHGGFGEVRAEIANGKTDVIRWAFLFWIGQAAALGGFLTYLKIEG